MLKLSPLPYDMTLLYLSIGHLDPWECLRVFIYYICIFISESTLSFTHAHAMWYIFIGDKFSLQIYNILV